MTAMCVTIKQCAKTHHAVDQDAEGDPEQQRESHHWTHDVIGQKLPKRVDVQFVDEVPQTLHHVLNLLHTLPLQRQHPPERWMSSFTSVRRIAGEAKRRWNLPLRRRSPQCRVCLYAGTGSCLLRPGRGRRRRRCSGSRLCTMSWFLQRGQTQMKTLHM